MVVILAGIDEAGLGPTLGPLVTASAALEVPDGWRADSPWRRLAGAVAERHSRKTGGLTVADSKLAYTSGGMPALELAVGAFLFSLRNAAGPELLFPADDLPAETHPCYSRGLLPFPVFVGSRAVSAAAEALGEALRRASARVAHLDIVALHESCLNRRYRAGLNKNQALLMETGRHLSVLEAKHPDREMLVVIDKQGGRNDYLPFLSALFPGRWLDTLASGADESAYRLRRGGGDMILRFQAKADRRSFPTALASMAAKYARERAMAEFNAWFCGLLPELKPTAGYPADAARWLSDVKKYGNPARCLMGMVVREK